MTKEQAVRDAAVALSNAIKAAREDGLYVQWPSSADDLAGIAISETGKASVTVQINTRGIAPDVAASAGEAAQKAADDVVAQAGRGVGEPLNISDEERAALPALDPDASNDPANFVKIAAADVDPIPEKRRKA